MKHTIAVEWKTGPVAGSISVTHGRLATCCGEPARRTFASSGKGPFRIEMTIECAPLQPGPDSPVVSVREKTNPFSFFLRDVHARFPIFIPAYGVAVTEASDRRSCAEIEEAIRATGLRTKLQQIEAEPEESFEGAAAHTRDLTCPTWLGVSRDMRIFEVSVETLGERWFSVIPRFHGFPVTLPEAKDTPVRCNFYIGRGVGPVRDITRRLEDGVLPILHTRVVDEDIVYHCTTFVTLERSRLAARTLRGTHFLVADGYGRGNMLTPEQKAQREALLPTEMNRTEETVLWYRIEAVNPTAAPRYAWVSLPTLTGASWSADGAPRDYDARTGLATVGERVWGVMRLNGRPAPQQEVAVLVQPGEKATFEFCLPHRPIPRARAAALARQSFERRHKECRAFWQAKLERGARIHLPEKRLDEMVRAGILHLDLVHYGLEPKGTLTPCIGVYCPIGSESSPIVQFLDAMGRHDIARRALMYFLDKQHEDGFIQNFGNYMLETGPALWSMGEHWRLTRDDAWVRAIQPKLIRACDYMIAWRKRNMKEEFRGRGYGMMDGKVADPADPYHIFMLNGYGYLGMSRVAEMLAKVAPKESRRIAREAEALKADIRKQFFEGMARSPVIPMSDGTWCPTAAPWAEITGPAALYVNKGFWFTHGSFFGRDSMLGPIYLILQEVLDPREPAADAVVNSGAELYHQRNGALSQPYYSPHLHVHLLRGEVKPFLKGYYTTVSALADRQTYTFWEHLYHVSPHKTHEEGWFLLQTRHMLWREEADRLLLLPAIPRRWLEHGKRIELEKAATRFGPVTLRLESRLQSEGTIVAEVECPIARGLKTVELRLPHPEGRKAISVAGGRYDPDRETVVFSPTRGRVRVVAQF